MFLFAFAVLGTQAAMVAKVGETAYETLEAAIAAAEPVDGVVTYEICGKAEVSATGWIQVLKKSGLSNVKKVAFVGTTEDAEICIAGGLAILADQQYDIDVSFRDLKLSKPNPEYGGDYGHSTNYFTTWLRNTGAAENTVTYENCTFPNGACNNQYGKTVYTNCTFANGTTGLYNLWIYGGSVEMDGGVFTGTRGMKVYTEGTPATAPSVEVKGTAFSGLTEKAAIVVSKAATVKFAEVSVADCQKGLFQKDIEGSSDDQKVTVTANGSKISGSFAITANREPETAKTEFNITGGMFTAEVPSDYCADGFTVKATTDADGNTVYGVVEKTELVNYVTLELVFGDNVADEDVVAAKALYAQEKYETCKAANEAYMALFGVTWGKGYLDVTDNTAPLYKYAGRSGSVSEVRFYIHGTLAGFTSLQSSGNQIDCTVGGNHQISRTSYSIIGVDGADGKAKLTDGNVQAYVAGGYASMFTASGKLTIDNIEFTSTTSTTVGASATRATESDTENEVASAEMEIKNCTFRGRLYVYDNFENQGKMTYSIHNCVFDGSNYSGDSNAYAIFAQCKGGNNLVIKDNAIAGFARGINIDHANVHATIEGNKISVTDTGRSCIQLSSLATADIVGNTLELTGGNAITLHEKLLTLGVVPEVSISGNTVTGTGYLIYDDAKANDKAFTSDNLKLTYATDNTVAETVDTTKGVKGSTAYITSTAVNNEVQHYVAQVGTTGYTTLAAAIAALSAENHTLTLLKENAWDAATPVYWAAGTQSGYAATLTEALTAAYKADAGAITIVCRPGADVGTMTHGHVADDLTIYGNDAFISGGECDLEVDQYKYSRATGAQAADGAYLEKDITITAYELDNLGVWGDRHTAHMVTVNLTDCDGKALEGKTNVQRVYISGTTGVNNITLTGCDFLTKATAVYSNADGAIKAVNCSFTDGQVPFNINHKANGKQTVAVENCTFTNCGDADGWKQFAAPLRLVNSGAGTQSAEVTGCAFADTVGANGDILLGDGRTGQASNDVELKVVNTKASIQAQKPGYYGGETVDATKKATATSLASDTLETSVAKLLPVDPRTLGYATSGKAEALPATPDMNGAVVDVTAAQAQYVLDGAYGPIDGKTINFTESINDTLILGRASKYDGSKTVYRHGSHAGEALSYAAFIAYKNQSVWTESCYYERTVENVTFTANKGVTVKNFEADGGAHIYAGTAPVYDYVRDTGSWVKEGSCYYKRATLKNITFKGLTFKAKTDINTSESTTVYDGFTFKDCTFDLGTTAGGNQAIRYYNENDNGNVKNLVVEGCTFKTCYQGVYTVHVKNVTVKDCTFDTTGHNAIAIQDFKGACDHGAVVITGNTFKGIGDRIIRFNNVGTGTQITIKDNAVTDAGLATTEAIKATSLAEGLTFDVANNDWSGYLPPTNEKLLDYAVASIGTARYATLAEAVKAAQAGETVTLLADITLTSKQSISKELTLDLNGKTLTGTALRTLFLGSGANVTIQDSSAEKTGKVANGYKGRADPYTICLDGYSAAALTLVSGTVEANPHKTDLQSVAINTNHEKDGPYAINIKGGKVFVPESSTNGRAIVAGKNVTLTVEGGEIVGGLHGVDVYGGSTTAITGGSISARVVDTGVIKAAYGLRATGTAFVTIGAADGTADVVSVAGIKMDDNGYKLDVPAVTVNSGTIAGPVYSITTGTIVFNVQATSEDVLRFADDTAAKFLSSNLELRAKDIDGKTMYYVAAKPVAAIGAIGYETLEAALAAAKDGETVKLLADVTVAGQLVAEKALTLDLGGKTVTSTYANGGYAFLTRAAVTVKNGTFAAGQARALSAYANLILEDATITSELAGGNCCVAFSAANCVYTVVNTKIVGAYAIANFAHNATIAITGSALEGSGCGLYHNGSNYGLKLTVSDTTINGAIDQAIGEGKDPSGVYLSGSLDVLANAENQNGAKGRHQATFTRCTIKGNTGVEVKYTDLTLEDCTVVATTKEPSYTQNNNGMAALGFAVVSTDNATGNATPKPEGTITITGADGSYTGLVGLGSLDSVKTGFADFEDAHYAVSGGTFSTAVLPEYCAAGFIPMENGDGTYGVKAGAYVAAIGTTGYETLEAALAAADAGATVKMLADVVLTEKQTIAKALVLDLNGKTISSTVDQFITIVKGGDLTVNDTTGEGCIKNTVTESWGGTIKMTGGVLTVNGGTIAANSATSEYSPTIEADTSSSATINVVGGRIEADRTGNARAINLRTQANVTLNVTGGEIVGSQNGIYSFAGNTINISAGVVAGKAGSAVYSSGKNRVLISGGTLTPGGTASALYISMGSSATVTIGREGGKVDDVTIPSIDVGGCTTTVTLLSGTVGAFKNWGSMTVAKVSQGKDTLLVGTDITACLPGSDLLCQLDAASGLYEIVKLTVENAAAIVTHDDVETPYHTVEQACKAVTDGDTLTLKVDHTGSQTLSFSAKNVTVDLGGKTLTYTGATGGLSSALSFNQSTASDNTVTVKNGTIVANAQDATCVRAEMTGDLSKTLTVVFGENLKLTSGNTSRYGGVVFGTGARTASPCEKMTKGGLLVTEGEKVWIYGETATAFTHAKGSEVTLLNDWYDTDTKGTVKVPSSGTFASAKLNLNGHTISSYGVNPAVLMGMVGENEDTAAKTLEISSGTIKTSRHGAAVCGSNKTLTLDGVTLTTTGDKMYGLYANGTTSGNTVTLKNKSAVLSEKATGIYFPGAGTLTVEDSNVTGGVSGIEVRAGVLNVSGTSVIASTAMEFSFTNNDNGTTTTGAAVAAVKHTVGNDLAVTITGGTFKGPRGFYANDPNVAKPGTVTVSISGGVFSTDVEKKYLADGCKTVQQTIDGTLYYVVGPAITQIGVTLGGEKKEMPFPDAWLAANIGADASTWTTAALEEKAANGLAKWQCYLFGLDPSKEDAKIVATAGQGTNEAIPLTVANADASASPLVKGGYVTVAYVLMGSNDGTAWMKVATSGKRDGLAIPLAGTTYKFYRVDVTVTSAEGN